MMPPTPDFHDVGREAVASADNQRGLTGKRGVCSVLAGLGGPRHFAETAAQWPPTLFRRGGQRNPGPVSTGPVRASTNLVEAQVRAWFQSAPHLDRDPVRGYRSADTLEGGGQNLASRASGGGPGWPLLDQRWIPPKEPPRT